MRTNINGWLSSKTSNEANCSACCELQMLVEGESLKKDSSVSKICDRIKPNIPENVAMPPENIQKYLYLI